MIMFVVHLSYDYGLSGTSGAPIAASRLHLALLRRGGDSHFVCVRRLEEGPNVHRLPTTWLGRKLFYLIPRVFWVLSKAFCGQLLMPNIWPLPGFSKLMRGLRPDIVHMHFIQSIFWGVGVAVLILIFLAVKEMWRKSVVDKFSCWIFFITFVLSALFKAPPAALIILAIFIGLWLQVQKNIEYGDKK